MTILPVLVAVVASASPPEAMRASSPQPGPRAAIVVGASAPVPGRPLLRHAHHDADVIADVLSSVGGFDRARVHVLHDPEPEALLAVVDREAAALAGVPHAMLFFYYSGHAGDGALFTAGKPVPVDALRRALDRADVSVRIGVLDACHGGEWTRAKGLVPDAPFEVPLPPLLVAEGSALIASSSGAESAHESDLLGGSFFTHHFAAALRGAADPGRHGEVTLGEAFEYARAQTIRETARASRETQHPSFALNLKGRQDVVLAQTAQSPSTLALDQGEGPLELVHLGSGLRLLELPPGRRSVVLAVPPGQYLVRKMGAGGVQAREISVPRDGGARVEEGDLVLVGSERLAVKGDGAPAGSVPRQWGEDLEVGVGQAAKPDGFASLDRSRWFGTGDSVTQGVRLDGRVGLTDHLAWKIGTLAFAYAIGAGGVEVVPYGGLLSWGRDSFTGAVRSDIGAGLGARVPLGGATALVATALLDRPSQTPIALPDRSPEFALHAELGFAVTGTLASFHIGAGIQSASFAAVQTGTLVPPPQQVGVGFVVEPVFLVLPAHRDTRWSVGSVQQLGLRSLPLVELHVSRGWSLNAYGALVHGPSRNTDYWLRAGVAKSF